jgi:hypothetical protein
MVEEWMESGERRAASGGGGGSVHAKMFEADRILGNRTDLF